MAVPGMVALLLHFTLEQLTLLWVGAVVVVIVAWFVHLVLRRTPPAQGVRWANDEQILLVLHALLLSIVPPHLYKIDGDAYAVGTFAADTLAGLPLNASEPLFGTTIGPGVRMVFNQSLSMTYLWSYFSAIDPITLAADNLAQHGGLVDSVVGLCAGQSRWR